MTPERKEMLEWLKEKMDNSHSGSSDDITIYNEFAQILELAPENLTYNVGKLWEDIPDGDKFMPVFVEAANDLFRITGVRYDNLDNLFDGFSGSGSAAVIETEL